MDCNFNASYKRNDVFPYPLGHNVNLLEEVICKNCSCLCISI